LGQGREEGNDKFVGRLQKRSKLSFLVSEIVDYVILPGVEK
jgi:hypothetical protein